MKKFYFLSLFLVAITTTVYANNSNGIFDYIVVDNEVWSTNPAEMICEIEKDGSCKDEKNRITKVVIQLKSKYVLERSKHRVLIQVYPDYTFFKSDKLVGYCSGSPTTTKVWKTLPVDLTRYSHWSPALTNGFFTPIRPSEYR